MGNFYDDPVITDSRERKVVGRGEVLSPVLYGCYLWLRDGCRLMVVDVLGENVKQLYDLWGVHLSLQITMGLCKQFWKDGHVCNVCPRKYHT